MSEPPPPSQTQPGHDLPIFYNIDGTQMQVFVEAGGILNRPKLIRSLKRHGAAICSDPKNAQVILVDSDTWQGKEFIREWGKDQNKVVLNHTWALKCVSEERMLLAQDNWGGCLTIDDGLPILRPLKSEDGEVEVKSALPTPRETPTESTSSSKQVPSNKPMAAASNRASTNSVPLPMNSAAGLTDSSAMIAPTPSNTFSPSQAPQSQYQSQPMNVVSQGPADPTSMFAPAIPFGMPPFNLNMSMMPFNPQLVAMYAQQQQGVAATPMGTQAIPNMPQVQENFATALMDIMKMYGAATPGGTSLNQQPLMFPGVMPTQMHQQQRSNSGSGSGIREGSSGSISTYRRDTRSPSSAPLLSMPQSPSVLQFPIKRKRASDDIPEHNLFDESGREDEEDEPLLTSVAKKKKQKEKKQKAKEKRLRRASLPYPAPSRNPHEIQSPTVKPGANAESPKKLFVNPEGTSMQFFVQVDLKDRLEVTRAIKKNGGTLTSEIATADFAVLYSRSTTFKELLSNATICRTPAVTFHFVLDAIEQGSIPDNLTNYLFDTKQNLMPKKKKPSSDAAAAETKRLEKNARQADRAARQRDMEYTYIARSGTPDSASPSRSVLSNSATVKKGTTSTPKPPKFNAQDRSIVKEKEKASTSAAASSSAPVSPPPKVVTKPKTPSKKASYYPKERTPTPPPAPETGWEKSGIGYSYSVPERRWAERYLFLMFKRDPTTSQTAVAKALHRKLPHHTVGSWSTFLGAQFRTEFEDCKKKGGIAHRKEKSLWEEEERKRKQAKEEKTREQLKPVEERGGEKLSLPSMDVDQSAENTDIPMENAATCQDKAAKEEKQRWDEEDDLNIVARFFAFDGGDEGDEPEEEVWARLEKKVKCKTASSWDDFYTLHHQEILRRYNEMVEKAMSATHG